MSADDLAAALADKASLGDYRGRSVIKTGIAISNAGDGLSKAMGIDPQILEPGDTVMVLLECEVGQHGFKLIPDTDCYELKQTLKAGTATIVDDNVNARRLRKQADTLKKKAEEAQGVTRLPGTDEEDVDPLYGDPDE